MTGSIDEDDKKGRKPTTDKVSPVGVPLTEELLAEIMDWASRQADTPVLTEAVRRLVELGLAGSKANRVKRSQSSSKSSELAGRQLDKMMDESASSEEQETRKRRLLKGPSEFREVRKDRKRK